MIKPTNYCSNTDREFSSVALGDYVKVFRNKHWKIGIVTKICPIQRHVRWLYPNKTGYVLDGHFQFLLDSEIDKLKSSRSTRDDNPDEVMQDLSRLVTRMLRIHAHDNRWSFDESAEVLYSSLKDEHTRQSRNDSSTKQEK